MTTGVWIVVAGVFVAAAAVLLRGRLPGPAVALLLAVSGAAVGWGGMLLQPDPSPAEVAVTIGALALLVPTHVRVVLGPFGRR